MIVRLFAARVSRDDAGKYYAFFREAVVPKLKAIPGHHGALVLSEEKQQDVAVTVLTFWDSDEAIRRFAGDDPMKAVVEPEVRAILSSYATQVTRMVVEVNALER
ncbi:MAG TPA: antibiotic biosynthesis monooxygenase [Candidatus Cybelea sp.]